MYNSQYYTCEQIDQRLLQGYLDDYNTENNTSLTKAQFLAKLGSILGVWQGVDVSPTDDSHNLVESGGVKKELTFLKDNFGGVNLEEIIFIEGKYIDTSGTSVPTENGEIVYTDRGSERCAAIQVTPGDVFLLNNRSNNSKWRAYGWAKSDFTFIDKTVGTYTCVEEVVVAPANAAWLILNDVNPNAGKYCYKGKNIQVQIDEKIGESEKFTTGEKVKETGIDNNILSGSNNLIKSGAVGIKLGSLIKEGSANVSDQTTTNVIPTYQLSNPIPSGTKIAIICEGLENVNNVKIIFNQTEVYVSSERYEYVLLEDLESIRVYVPTTQVVVSGGEVKVHLYCYGIEQQLDKLKQEVLEIPQNTKFSTNEVLSGTSIINEIGAGSEHDVVSAQYANELCKNIYNQVVIDNRESFNVKIGSGNTFVAQNEGFVTFPVKKGNLVKIEPSTSKSVFFTLLSSIDNIAEGNTPIYIDGYQLIKRDTATSIIIPMDCFFCYNRYAPNTSSTAYPKKCELYTPLKNNVSFSNLADTKTIYSNSTTTSNSTVYVVALDNIQIKAGSTLRINLSGIGVYSSYARLLLNDDSAWTMLVNGENVVKLTKDVTRIRVQLNRSQFIAEGTITANVEVDDIGNVLKEVIDKTQKNLPITLTVQDLIKAAGTESNTFTESFEFNVKSSILKDSNVIFTCSAKYETSDVNVIPYIAIDDRSRGTSNVQKRSKGLIGGNGHYEIRQWRHPLLINSDTLRVRIVIPNGVSLTINTFSATTSNEINRNAFKVYGHSRGYWSYDFNARLSFELAAVSGYYGAIAVPKLTTDGVFVCYHDDDILSVNNNLQMKGGEPLTTELGALRMNELTYAQTQMLESIDTNILGEHDTIPTLAEFFEICNKTGLHPCLSVHPYLTATELEQVKDLAKEYNVLNRLTYKSSMDSTRAGIDYSVFGNEIESYIYDTHPDQIVQRTGWLDAVGYDLTKITVGLEMMGEIADIMAHYSDIETFKSKGYKLGLAIGFYEIADIQKFMKLGLYEWTADNFFNNGLNW